MRRIRWFEPDDPSTPVEWPAVAAILATLFLNFSFWLGVADRFNMAWPLPTYVALAAVVVMSTTAFAVVRPWLASSGEKSLFRLVEDSLGAFPSHIIRWICVGFAAFWLAAAISLPVRVWLYFRHEPSWHEYFWTYLLVGFLCLTGLQSLRTEARLALFTSKLAVALLVAALWRVHDGWPAIQGGFEHMWGEPTAPRLWSGLAELSAYVVPFGLLAADLSARLRTRKDAVLAATAGIAIPLFGSVLLAGIVAVATAKSQFYQPSLNPTVSMALFGHVASSALPGRWAIGAITIFGVARFCIRSLSISVPVQPVRWKWAVVGLVCAVSCWLSLHPFAVWFEATMRGLANCLGAVSAILTADWLVRHRAASRRIDWTALAAFAIGIVVPWLLPHQWWEPRVLPCYGVAFAACVAGRWGTRAVTFASTGICGH